MFESEGIIITEKHKPGLSIITGSIWVTISLLIAGAAFKTIPLITSDIAAQGKLLRIIGYILGFFLIIGLNLESIHLIPSFGLKWIRSIH